MGCIVRLCRRVAKMTQTSHSDRPRVMLSPDREAWYEDAMAKCREACDASKQRVIETARAKGVVVDGE